MLPPRLLLFCLLYLSKSYFLFIAGLSFPGESENFLRLFYPQQVDLYMGLCAGLPAIGVFLITGFREKLWKRGNRVLFNSIVPLIVVSLLCQLWLLISAGASQYWQFSWTLGMSGLTNVFFLYWVLFSRHMTIMLKDWRKPSPS